MKKISTITICLLFFFVIVSGIFIHINPVKADNPYSSNSWGRRYYITTNTVLNSLTGDTHLRVKTQAWAVTPNGTICCIIQGTHNGAGTYTLYICKSYDNGSSWTSPEVFVDDCFELSDYGYTAMTVNDYDNVYPDKTFVYICGVKSGNYHHYVVWTEDNATTWEGISGGSITSDAIDVSDKTGLSTSTNYQPAGTGIIHSSGRFIMPCFHHYGGENQNVFSIYSDDVELGTGSSWSSSSEYGTGAEYSEVSICELYNNSLFATLRDGEANGEANRKHYGFCENPTGSIAWRIEDNNKFPYYNNLLACEEYSDVGRLTDNTTYSKNRIVLLWNNHTFTGSATSSRRFITLAISNDEGQTWNYSRQVTGDEYTSHPKLCIADNNTILVGYKNDSVSELQNWVFQCNIEWVSQGTDQLVLSPESESETSSSTDHYFIDINNYENNSILYTGRRTYNVSFPENDTIVYWQIRIANDSSFSDAMNISFINETNMGIYFNEFNGNMYFKDVDTLKQHGMDYGEHYYSVRYRRKVVSS